MKKISNRYRNNNSNNAIYSLNYKFDSNSVAGKISGTALDLIKKYNDLAKEAHSNNDYITAEIFRQYAEHYRKIVTEINERKQAREQQEANDNSNAKVDPAVDDKATEESALSTDCQQLTEKQENIAVNNTENKENKKIRAVKKSFHVIEINRSETEEKANISETQPKPKRVYRRKNVAVEAAEA